MNAKSSDRVWRVRHQVVESRNDLVTLLTLDFDGASVRDSDTHVVLASFAEQLSAVGLGPSIPMAISLDHAGIKVALRDTDAAVKKKNTLSFTLTCTGSHYVRS